MKIAGFLQNKNGVANGFLEQCLTSMRHICDPIFVYDDASDENVGRIYDNYECIVVYGEVGSFKRELYHKQELLAVALRSQPDWICWFDNDAILGRMWEDKEKAETVLSQAKGQGIHLLMLHNLNLWRSPWWYRVDQSFDDLWHGVFWQNTGELHYAPVERLHQKQYPVFWRDPHKESTSSRLDVIEAQLLHFGFASEEEIARKYYIYKENGQTDWALNRLVDESTLQLKAVSPSWHPSWLDLPPFEPAPKPKLWPALMDRWPNFDEWEKSQ